MELANKTKWKPKSVIPANVDPIELADKLKAGMTTEWLKRRAKLKSNPKSPLVQRA